MNREFPLYSFRDKKFGFLSPFIDVSDELACRQFVHLILSSKDEESSVVQSMAGIPLADLELHRVGSINVETGVISALPVPQLIVSADSVGVLFNENGDFLGDISDIAPDIVEI